MKVTSAVALASILTASQVSIVFRLLLRYPCAHYSRHGKSRLPLASRRATLGLRLAFLPRELSLLALPWLARLGRPCPRLLLVMRLLLPPSRPLRPRRLLTRRLLPVRSRYPSRLRARLLLVLRCLSLPRPLRPPAALLSLLRLRLLAWPLAPPR